MLRTNYKINCEPICNVMSEKIININKTRDKIISRKILNWYREDMKPINEGFFKFVDLVHSKGLTFKVSEKKLFKKYLKMLYFNRAKREII